jgi:hypothetical protein
VPVPRLITTVPGLSGFTPGMRVAVEFTMLPTMVWKLTVWFPEIPYENNRVILKG